MRVNRARPRMFRTSRRALAGLGALLLAGLMVPLATVAMADEVPTSMELLEKCGNGTDLCEFHVSGATRTFFSPSEVASQTANCTDKDQTASLMWEKTFTSTNSLGVSLKVSWGPTKAFEVGFKVAYQHEWISSTTDRDTTQITIPAGHMGRIYLAREMEEVSGKYEMHFPDRFYDHYYWYLPMTVTSPKADGKDAVVPKSDPLTDQERASFCAA